LGKPCASVSVGRAADKYRCTWRTAMETLQFDDVAGEDAVIAHRARAREMLNDIVVQARQALAEQGFSNMPLFFLIPSGNAVVTFGTTGDPSDHEWHRVAEIVEPIVRQAVGLDRTRCQEVVCATTQDQECSDATA
jgi:hypothetical protein